MGATTPCRCASASVGNSIGTMIKTSSWEEGPKVSYPGRVGRVEVAGLPTQARARTAATRWLACCSSLNSVTLPDTRMSMTPSACGTIRRCARSSAVKPSWAVQLRRARLAALRRNGLLQTRIFLLLPTRPVNESTLCMAADRPRHRVRHEFEREPDLASKRIACGTAITAAPVITAVRVQSVRRSGTLRELRPGNVHSADGWKMGSTWSCNAHAHLRRPQQIDASAAVAKAGSRMASTNKSLAQTNKSQEGVRAI
jgi:hypothetical protein